MKIDKTELAWAWYALERISNIRKAIEDEIRKETAKAIFEEIEKHNEGEEDEFYISMNVKDWKKLKEKWLK